MIPEKASRTVTQTVQVQGFGFLDSECLSCVMSTGARVPAQFISANSLTCRLPVFEQAELSQDSNMSSSNRSNASGSPTLTQLADWSHLGTPVQVWVSNDGGVQTSVNSVTYTYLEPPTLERVSPPSAMARRHTTVNISGSNFYEAPGATLCSFSDLLLVNATFISSTKLQCITPKL